MTDAPDQWKLSTMSIVRVPAMTALVCRGQVTVPAIPQFAEAATTRLMRYTRDRHIEVIAPPLFIYTGAGTGPDDPFTLEVAFPIADHAAIDAGNGDDIARRHIEAFDCASFEYHGPMQHLGDAYPHAMNALKAEGHTPVEQSREVYRRWAGYDSPANVIEIQLGIA
jgi:hypothetical protein